jgi:hypothetical protein
VVEYKDAVLVHTLFKLLRDGSVSILLKNRCAGVRCHSPESLLGISVTSVNGAVTRNFLSTFFRCLATVRTDTVVKLAW